MKCYLVFTTLLAIGLPYHVHAQYTDKESCERAGRIWKQFGNMGYCSSQILVKPLEKKPDLRLPLIPQDGEGGVSDMTSGILYQQLMTVPIDQLDNNMKKIMEAIDSGVAIDK